MISIPVQLHLLIYGLYPEKFKPLSIMVAEKNYILTEAVAEKKLRRMAYEILENNSGEKSILLAGIRESGSVVARNVEKMLKEISSLSTQVITITLDKKFPTTVELSHAVDLNDKAVIIIDDVTNTGKTMLYALKPFLEFHPKRIQTLVLVERSHKTFPVHPDYVGISIATTMQEHIYVEVDKDTVKGAWLE
jgi:pyrimidine operon attenuation protein/uracil phosphoribosyltransferase